ncbi:MAG: hypothetical protein JWP44_5130, partial [Mucilaginibacter sp.]|nr:hypothetical protein [Mucilaginibacter sp.]
MVSLSLAPQVADDSGTSLYKSAGAPEMCQASTYELAHPRREAPKLTNCFVLFEEVFPSHR